MNSEIVRYKLKSPLNKMVQDHPNIMVGEIIKKEVTADPIFGIVTKNTFSVIGALKGNHKPHDKVNLRELGANHEWQLHDKQILLLFTYLPRDQESRKELKENWGTEEVASIALEYARTHINDFTTLVNEPFTSNKVDDISFSKVMLIKDAKLPNEVTLGQIKKLVK